MSGKAIFELVFMMLILKIPIVYLCLVVYWAIRAEPKPLEGAALGARLVPDPEPGSASPCPWRRRPPRPLRPLGRRAGRAARRARVAP